MSKVTQTPARGKARVVRSIDCERNTLKALVDIELPSGLVLCGCSYHVREASEWVGLPGAPVVKDGQLARDERGKVQYRRCVDTTSKEVYRQLQGVMLAAIHEHRESQRG